MSTTTPGSLTVLADENVSMRSVQLLRAHGLDVACVQEVDPGLSDPDVIRLARRLDRVLVTFDSDIGERIFREGDPPPPGVIYLRFIQSNPEETARVVLQVLDLGVLGPPWAFVTYRNGRVRHQPLPTPRPPRAGRDG